MNKKNNIGSKIDADIEFAVIDKIKRTLKTLSESTEYKVIDTFSKLGYLAMHRYITISTYIHN